MSQQHATNEEALRKDPWERLERVMVTQGRKWLWLAVQMGISDNTLRNMRADGREPSELQKKLIAEALGVALTDIWAEEAGQ